MALATRISVLSHENEALKKRKADSLEGEILVTRAELLQAVEECERETRKQKKEKGKHSRVLSIEPQSPLENVVQAMLAQMGRQDLVVQHCIVVA